MTTKPTHKNSSHGYSNILRRRPAILFPLTSGFLLSAVATILVSTSPLNAQGIEEAGEHPSLVTVHLDTFRKKLNWIKKELQSAEGRERIAKMDPILTIDLAKDMDFIKELLEINNRLILTPDINLNLKIEADSVQRLRESASEISLTIRGFDAKLPENPQLPDKLGLIMEMTKNLEKEVKVSSN